MAGDDGCGDAPAGADALTDQTTIVALSSGALPAAIAILRVSGPAARAAVAAVASTLPAPRHAALRAIRDVEGRLLDRALVLVFPGPASATGEDLVEVHCHGGRAVAAAVQRALLGQPGVRTAEPGEFTRRALLNGRIDLTQAQGLADLLAAESEAERRLAMEAAEGAVAQAIRGWMDRLTDAAALIEAAIDFAEEGDVCDSGATLTHARAVIAALVADMTAVVDAPPVERWQDGWRVVIAGPPNAGKSTLLNLLAQREAAIVSPIAGTTRDRIEVVVRRGGVGYRLTDTAGLRDATDDPIERIGIERGEAAIRDADLVIWLGDDEPADGRYLWLHARADEAGRDITPAGRLLAVRHDRPATIEAVWRMIEGRLVDGAALPAVPLHRQDQAACRDVLAQLAEPQPDEVLLAEAVREARGRLAALLGIDATEHLLDRVFSRFCLGK